MTTDTFKESKIPVNLITGFLGAGKTTAIRHLLRHKPADQHWAVLVNEMGEVGIDGPLFEQDGIAVKQVAGGCMCCVSDLPSKVALNELIRRQRPDRILIEPSGIARPRTILNTYGSVEYKSLLQLQATVCLVDPWSITRPEILELPTFTEQIELADVLLVSKADVASEEELAAFYRFVERLGEKALVTAIADGAIDPAWLSLTRQPSGGVAHHHHHEHHHHHHAEDTGEVTEPLVADAEGVIRRENENAEAFGCGWLFPKNWVFTFTGLESLLMELEVPRIKGIVQTNDGWYTVNRMREHSRWDSAQAPDDGVSAVEMIALSATDWKLIDAQLRELARKNTEEGEVN